MRPDYSGMAWEMLGYADASGDKEPVVYPAIAERTVNDQFDAGSIVVAIGKRFKDVLQLAENGEIGDLTVSVTFRYRSLQKDWRSRRERYAEYLASQEWKAKADAAKETAGRRCQVCNSPGPILDAHHRTYERVGDELPGDLIVLCRDCHTLFHDHKRVARIA